MFRTRPERRRIFEKVTRWCRWGVLNVTTWLPKSVLLVASSVTCGSGKKYKKCCHREFSMI
ncbi:MAG: SEC-C domain-containing protein [Deltaproteobacteria bacterium]|nr:SEC-C domain-containing protein [Deltaproteobacteria bacterium]